MTDRKGIPTLEREVQHLRAKCARYEIELDLARCLLENDSYDPTATDMEYWGPLHDKVRELQSHVLVQGKSGFAIGNMMHLYNARYIARYIAELKREHKAALLRLQAENAELRGA